MEGPDGRHRQREPYRGRIEVRSIPNLTAYGARSRLIFNSIVIELELKSILPAFVDDVLNVFRCKITIFLVIGVYDAKYRSVLARDLMLK